MAIVPRRIAGWVAALLVLIAPAATLRADPADIAAVSRSVVRIVLVAEADGQVYYVGHGSGVAVSPTRIVTNAHLVAMLREDPSIVIGIVPSQGSESYGGKLVAYSPGNDLALIALENGRLPPATLLAKPLEDGARVIAIGYPGSVDRAEGLSVGELVEPMAPVKTPGVVSSGRSTRDFDTLLHTAPIAQGNSGGPLVDDCGRVVGINSFGSLSDGNDAEFGFAVSNRELIAFLRKAKVDVNLNATPCRSAAEISSAERARSEAALADARARARAEESARSERLGTATARAERDIAMARENHLALAALLLALGVLAGSGAMLLYSRGDLQRTRYAAGGGGALALGAILVFALRPSYDRAPEIAAQALRQAAHGAAVAQSAAEGRLICAIQPERSRVTVSETDPVTLDWTATGCVNGRTQYGRSGARWSRVFVPDSDDRVSINSYEPATGTFRTEQFLLSLDDIDRARTIRDRYRYEGCTRAPDVLAELADMQAALRQALPAQPNEILTYACHRSNARAATAEPASPEPAEPKPARARPNAGKPDATKSDRPASNRAGAPSAPGR